MSSLQNLSWFTWIKVLSDSVSIAILYAVPCPKDSGGGPGVLARMGEGHMETNLQVIASLLLDRSVGSEALQNPPGWSRELQPEAQFGG